MCPGLGSWYKVRSRERRTGGVEDHAEVQRREPAQLAHHLHAVVHHVLAPGRHSSVSVRTPVH